MISRTAFCSAQAARMLAARTGPMPSTSRSRSGVVSMISKTFSPKARTSFLAAPACEPVSRDLRKKKHAWRRRTSTITSRPVGMD